MSGNQNYTILFVDDEPWLSDALRLSLEGSGFNCISAEDATEAWRKMEQGGIDVVVKLISSKATGRTSFG